MKYNTWKAKMDNATKRDAELFDRKYKLASLEQDQKQFLAELIQRGLISEATLKQRADESKQEHLDRLAAIAAANQRAEQRSTSKFNDKFNGAEDQVVPVKMPDGTIKYLSGTEAYTILARISKNETDRFNNDPMIKRIGGNDFTIGEASGLLGNYGVEYLTPYQTPIDPFEPPQTSTPVKKSSQPAKKQSSGGWTRVDANGNPIK